MDIIFIILGGILFLIWLIPISVCLVEYFKNRSEDV